MMGLEGKVAVVTGGSTGLGRAIVERYVGAGVRVVLADIRRDEGEAVAEQLRKDGGEVVFVQTDVSDGDQVLHAVTVAEETFGGLHIMTANAGVMGRSHRKPIVDVPDEDRDFVFRVNFNGTWYCFQHAIPAIRRSGGVGAMTVTASTSAIKGMGNLPAYSSSKAAILGLTRSVAADVGPAIRVNAVVAGSMETELPAHTAELMGLETSAVRSASPAAHRTVDPDLMARAHLFLVSDLGAHVNGQSIMVDGGHGNLPA